MKNQIAKMRELALYLKMRGLKDSWNRYADRLVDAERVLGDTGWHIDPIFSPSGKRFEP